MLATQRRMETPCPAWELRGTWNHTSVGRMEVEGGFPAVAALGKSWLGGGVTSA